MNFNIYAAANISAENKQISKFLHDLEQAKRIEAYVKTKDIPRVNVDSTVKMKIENVKGGKCFFVEVANPAVSVAANKDGIKVRGKGFWSLLSWKFKNENKLLQYLTSNNHYNEKELLSLCTGKELVQRIGNKIQVTLNLGKEENAKLIFIDGKIIAIKISAKEVFIEITEIKIT